MRAAVHFAALLLGACAAEAMPAATAREPSAGTALSSGKEAEAEAEVEVAPPPVTPTAPQRWRAEHRLIDLHVHIDPTEEHMAQAMRLLGAVGVGVAIDLSGGFVTHLKGKPSDFEVLKAYGDATYPGRLLFYMNLDYSSWDQPDFSRRAVEQVEEGARLGAAGFKEFKRLGLYQRDGKGKLIAIDDKKLDPMWKRLGELGMPVSIHVADPKAFWEPYDEHNERWEELKDHPKWWFGDPAKYPPRMELLAALERVVARHPETTFVCVHMGNDAEDLDWVAAQLDAHPNMNVDIAARVPEFGRKEPARARAFFEKYADRILFATDFQVYERLVLGSGGSGPPPSEADAMTFYEKHWEYFETDHRIFPNMTPIQGDWPIYGIDLPEAVLKKVYFANAERLLAKPLARLRAGPPPAPR